MSIEIKEIENDEIEYYYSLFKKQVDNYISFFNLKNWETNINKTDNDSVFGTCVAFPNDRMAIIQLSTVNLKKALIEMKEDNHDNDYVRRELSKVAFHEVMELMLFKLRDMANEKEKIIHWDEVDSEIHSIIRTMENVIFPVIDEKLRT